MDGLAGQSVATGTAESNTPADSSGQSQHVLMAIIVSGGTVSASRSMCSCMYLVVP
jgi:hypothetical protein